MDERIRVTVEKGDFFVCHFRGNHLTIDTYDNSYLNWVFTQNPDIFFVGFISHPLGINQRYLVKG